MDKLMELLVNIVTGKKSRLFWAVIIVLAIVIVIIYPYIDANILYYDRIEKRIDNLQKLVDLTGKPLEENEALNNEYLSILEEMENAREKALSNATSIEDSMHDRRVKFLAGASLWYLAAVMVLFTKKKTEKWSLKKVINNFCAAALCFGIGTGIGWIFTKIPTIGGVEVNAGFTLILEVAVLWLLIEQPKKKVLATEA